MKVQVDTDDMRKRAEADFAEARVRYDETMRLIDAIEHWPSGRSAGIAEGQPGAQPQSGETWVGIRQAIRLVGDGKQITVKSATEDIHHLFPHQPVTESQVASALRKLVDKEELRRIRPGSLGTPAIFEFRKSSSEGGEEE